MMTIETVIAISEQALLTILFIVGPPLAAAMAVGLFVAVMQAATQIQETSLTFVPKLTAASLALLLTARWNINHLISFMHEIMSHFEGVAR
jgi:flagellar biosynthetic protein FliQ